MIPHSCREARQAQGGDTARCAPLIYISTVSNKSDAIVGMKMRFDDRFWLPDDSNDPCEFGT